MEVKVQPETRLPRHGSLCLIPGTILKHRIKCPGIILGVCPRSRGECYQVPESATQSGTERIVIRSLGRRQYLNPWAPLKPRSPVKALRTTDVLGGISFSRRPSLPVKWLRSGEIFWGYQSWNHGSLVH